MTHDPIISRLIVVCWTLCIAQVIYLYAYIYVSREEAYEENWADDCTNACILGHLAKTTYLRTQAQSWKTHWDKGTSNMPPMNMKLWHTRWDKQHATKEHETSRSSTCPYPRNENPLMKEWSLHIANILLINTWRRINPNRYNFNWYNLYANQTHKRRAINKFHHMFTLVFHCYSMSEKLRIILDIVGKPDYVSRIWWQFHFQRRKFLTEINLKHNNRTHRNPTI